MKLLAVFFVVCALLAALFAYQLLTSGTAGEGPDVVSAARSATTTQPRGTPAPVGASPHNQNRAREEAATEPTNVAEQPAPEPPRTGTGVRANADKPPGLPERPSSRPAVRWADDPDRHAAQRRLAAARRTLTSDPYNVAALRDELSALRQLECWDEALTPLGRLLEIDADDPDLRFTQATLLMRVSRWLRAVDALRALIDREPDHARAWYNLAVAHQKLGHLRQARAAWDRVLALTPDAHDAHALRGEVLLDLHEWSAAAADLEAALQRDPASLESAMNLSLALWKLDRTGEARELLVAILERRPKHVPTMNRLAEMAWAAYAFDRATHAAQRQAAISWCRRSLEVDPDQPSVAALLREAENAE